MILPCLITGLIGYFASEEIVSRLLKHAQINLAREIATQVSVDFKTSRADLKLLSRLPVLKDYYYNRFYGLESEAEISRKQTEEFFQDVARKSDLYYRISYLDPQGQQVACVQACQIVTQPVKRNDLPLDLFKDAFPSDQSFVSEVMAARPNEPKVLHLAQPLFDVWNRLSGVVLIELNFTDLTRRILSRRVGNEGYAFVADNNGRVLIHPENRHVGKMAEDLEEPSVEKLIRAMLRDRQGMAPYYYNGRKIAAFTEVQDTGWIIAVTLPIAEFTAHVTVIKSQVLHIVLLAGSLALAAGVFFSWHFLRPIKKLARATNVIAEGRLPPTISFKSSDELGILTRSFNEMVKNLRGVQAELVKTEKLVSLGRMASGVAHEIRNPLNTMNVTLGLLKRKVAGHPDILELSEMISEEIARVDHFLSDFLSYSKQPPPKPTLTNVNEMVDDILEAYSAQAESKKIVLEKKLDPLLPLFPLDSFQVERAIRNIVVNALEAMREGDRLTITTKWRAAPFAQMSGASLELSIADTGPGMSPEELQNAFDPFYTTKELGTGLGLPLTQSIVEGHGGSIKMHSKPNGGTEVVIILPQDLTPVVLG